MEALLRLAERQHGLISLTQARDLGFSQQSVHRRGGSSVWEPVTDEVLRRRGAPAGRGARVMAAVLDAGTGSVLSFACGAAWWRVSGPSLEPVHVVRVSRTHRPSRLGAEVHTVRRLPDRWTTVLDGVPVARPELVALHLFASEPYPRAERWVERLWSMRLLSGPSIGRMLMDLGARGRNGIAGARRYLDDRGPGYVPAASGLESRAIDVLRRAGIAVDRQVNVGNEAQWTGRVDLKVLGLPVLIEVQSELHHSALVDVDSDQRRIAELRAAGFIVVELTDSEVWVSPDEVIRKVNAAIATARSVRRFTT